MSRRSVEAVLHIQMKETAEVCKLVSAEMGWRLKRESPGELVFLEPYWKWRRLWANRTKVTVTLLTQGDRTHASFDGQNLGLGPCQARHVKREVVALRDRVLSVLGGGR